MGRILNTHYNTKEKVEQLIDGGDMSSCWTKDTWTRSMSTFESMQNEDYGPQYYKDRGEDCPPRLDESVLDYLNPDNSEEYAYLFRKGEWVCYNMNQFDSSKSAEIVEIPSAALDV